jgi:hypothetical protein
MGATARGESNGSSIMNAVAIVSPLRRVVAVTGTRLLRQGRRRILDGGAGTAAHLDRVVEAFQAGYLAACRAADVAAIPEQLSSVDGSRRGFAYEGAAMALGLLDALSPWSKHRLSRLFALAGGYTYLLHVGAGWALARVGRLEGARFHQLDPLLKWLALDGVGFHDGFMRPGTGAPIGPRPGMSAYAARVFDQGVGRSLWFTARAQSNAIIDRIAAAPVQRRPDLWSGVGLACAYAGGVTIAEIRQLQSACGALRAHLAQGVAFAAAAHMRGLGRVPPHTEVASEAICGMRAAQAAAVARDCASGLTSSAAEPAYETWRTRVRERLS